MTDNLRRQWADALTAAAYECDGQCGLTERACYDAHPVTFSARAGGTTHVDGAVTAIADICAGVRDTELDRLHQALAEERDVAVRKEAENERLRAELDENTGVMKALRRQRDEAEATLDRAREYVETTDDDGIRTRENVLRILDTTKDAASNATCGECGHPKGQHGEGEDPVTPGQCRQCAAEGGEEDESWHDYQPKDARG